MHRTRHIGQPLKRLSLAGICLCVPATLAETPGSLEEVIVYGRAQQYYLEETSTTGSKIEMDIINVPQSVQVLSKQLMIDQAARQITDMYRSIAGVSEFSYSGVTVRGFRESDNVFYDGVRGDPYEGFSVPQLFNIERIEVLLGPSAALYGGGDPGGMINYITKTPSFEPETRFTATAGNYNLYGGSLDTTGALTTSTAGRIGMFYEQQDSFRDNADLDNTLVVGGLLFEPTDQTAVNLKAEYVDQDLGGNRLRGVFVRDDGSSIVDRSYNTAEAIDSQKLEAYIGQLNVKHQFDESLSLNSTLRYLDNDRDQAYHEPRGWVDSNGDGEANELDGEIRREYRVQARTNREYSLTMDLVKTFSIGSWENTTLVGGDHHYIDASAEISVAFAGTGGVPNLNVFNPNYGEADPANYTIVSLGDLDTDTKMSGLYLQHLIDFNSHWSLMLGLRYDDFEDKDKNEDFKYSDDNTSTRAGLVFKPVEDGSLYLNYSESFSPLPLTDQFDPDSPGTLPPETGYQWELGWKQDWLEGGLRSTVAVYTITKEDIPQPNPDDNGDMDGIPAQVSLGKVESDGYELTLVGDLTDRLVMTGNYAYNDVKIVEGSDFSNSFRAGSRFANAPKHQAGLWMRYALPDIQSSIALGMEYVSNQVNLDGQRIDSFTVYDASWSTQFDNLVFQVNIKNIFDKDYFVSGLSERLGNFPGAPREYIFEMRYTL